MDHNKPEASVMPEDADDLEDVGRRNTLIAERGHVYSFAGDERTAIKLSIGADSDNGQGVTPLASITIVGAEELDLVIEFLTKHRKWMTEGDEDAG